jgi:hypothetical protein
MPHINFNPTPKAERVIFLSEWMLLQEMSLTPCAGRLWRWLLRQQPAGTVLEFRLADFQEYTALKRTQPYSLASIRKAFQELERHDLLRIVERSRSLTGLLRVIVRDNP